MKVYYNNFLIFFINVGLFMVLICLFINFLFLKNRIVGILWILNFVGRLLFLFILYLFMIIFFLYFLVSLLMIGFIIL